MAERIDLLIEIGCEELPPKALLRLANVFSETIFKTLAEQNFEPQGHQVFASPRRLATRISQVLAVQEAREIERRGPALAAAYDDQGQPTKAAMGFARSCGVDVADLERVETDKGTWLFYRIKEAGKAIETVLAEVVGQAIAQLPTPKRMRWGDNSFEFVRPVHWLIMLAGDRVVEAELLGVPSGRETRGHRVMGRGPVIISSPAEYETVLEQQGRVIADFNRRREMVASQVKSLAKDLGGQARIDSALLDEVTAIVEWPVALHGDFDQAFLDVPAEALISSMQSHQKYFPVTGEQGELLPHFITVANIDSKDFSQVREGNERVIRPRLADAAFFQKQDRKQTLSDRVETLKTVVFQTKLGTLHDRGQRVAAIARTIASAIGGDEEWAARASLLAKCDLMTEMVGEFPELQGTMGRYYATYDQESAEVAQAIGEQYQPAFAGDALPGSKTGQALAIADKTDLLAGIFAINQPPKGDKDPFGLRRAALGLLRITIEQGVDIDLRQTLQQALGLIAEHMQDPKLDISAVESSLIQFMLDRLRAYYSEIGVGAEVFNRVREHVLEGGGAVSPVDFDQRVRGVHAFLALPEAESLLAANKRIHNILKKAGDIDPSLEAALLKEPQERSLHDALAHLEQTVTALIDDRQYEAALKQLSTLRNNVDDFFDHVMVMADDEALKANRIALLSKLASLFKRVADFS